MRFELTMLTADADVGRIAEHHALDVWRPSPPERGDVRDRDQTFIGRAERGFDFLGWTRAASAGSKARYPFACRMGWHHERRLRRAARSTSFSVTLRAQTIRLSLLPQ